MQNNRIKQSLLFILIAGITAITTQSIAKDTTYYRYKNEEGNPVITTTLPPEVAEKGGYEIISPRGNVLETVGLSQPQDKQSLADQKAAELKVQEEQKAVAIQAKKDEILLKSFSSEEDIIRSRDEKIASIKILQEITNDNITRLKKQLIDAKTSFEKYKKSGEKAPLLQKTIDESQRQINENLNFLERKNAEIKDINTNYDGLIKRFQELQKRNPAISTPASTTNTTTNRPTSPVSTPTSESAPASPMSAPNTQ